MGHEGAKKHPGMMKIDEPWKPFEVFFNRLDEALIVVDVDGRVCFLNQMAQDFYPQQVDWSALRFEKLPEAEHIAERDYFLLPGDGVPVTLKTYLPTWGEGRFIIVLARPIYPDHDLRRSTIIENTAVGFFRCRTDGRLLFINNGLVNILGYPDKETLLPVNACDLIDETLEEGRRFFDQLKHHHHIRNEEMAVRRYDGGKVIVECCVILVKNERDERFSSYEGTVQDITSRKYSERVQRENEVRLRSITEQNKDGIVLLNAARKIVGWNKATEGMTGLSSDEVINRPYREIAQLARAEMVDILTGETFEDYLDDESIVNDRHNIKQLSFNIYRPDGSQRCIEVIPFPIQEDDINFIGVFLRDMSDRVRADVQLKRQVEELSVLNDVAKAGAEATDEAQLIAYVVKRVGQQLYPDHFGVMMVDELQEYLYGNYTYSSTKNENNSQNQWKIPLGMGIAGSVARTGISRNVGDVSKDQDYIIIHPETCSELCVPLKSGGTVFGILKIESSEYFAFDASDEALLNAIADQLATAIAKIRLVNVERRRRLEAETLSRASYSLVSSFQLKETLDSYLGFLMQAIPCDQSVMLVKEEEGESLRVYASKGIKEFLPEVGQTLDKNNPMVQMMHNTVMPLQFSDFIHKQHMSHEDAELLKHHPVALFVPLLVRGDTTGYLLMSRKSEPRFSEKDITLAETFANHAAVAVENAHLFESTRRRAEEMEALTKVSMSLRKAETALDMIPILVEEVVDIFDVNALAFYLLERDMLELVGAYGPARQYLKSCFPFINDEIYWKVVCSGEALINPDEKERASLSGSYIFNMTMGESSGMLGGAIIPLKSSEAVVGLMHLALKEGRNLSEEDSRLLIALAEIAANALNRAIIMETLEQRVALRISQLSTLYMISSISNEHRPLPELLERMLEQLLDALETSIGIVLLMDECKKYLSLGVQIGVPEKKQAFLKHIPIRGETWDWSGWLFEEPEPLVISDILSDDRLPNDLYIEGYSSVIATPIRLNRGTLGLMLVMGKSFESFSAEDLGLFSVISEQIGTTIENTRLRKQAEEMAVFEERQRLARELHDSVTQSLYSVFLMANGARKLAQMNKMERCMHYLEELSQTAEEALKEMRLLIYQLRPAALEQEGLQEALRQRLEVVEKRAGVCIQYSGELPFKLAPDVEEGLYRVVMEALNNILKHARANSVSVRLTSEGERTVIEIEDDGIGFDINSASVQMGIGLNSMRERAEKMGGKLLISSQNEKGTLVKVIV